VLNFKNVVNIHHWAAYTLVPSNTNRSSRYDIVNYIELNINVAKSVFTIIIICIGARGSVVGSGTMLQAGRSRVRVPMRSLDFSIDLILPAAQRPGVDSARNLPGGKELPAREADNHTAICEPIV
jgi:hypothetical protein